MKKINVDLSRFIISDEELVKERKKRYKTVKQNPENMSFWLPKILSSTTRISSILKVPDTKIENLDFGWWNWLHTDSYSDENVAKFNEYLIGKLDDFHEGETLFMKSGVFSNKFLFSDAVVNDRCNIGEQFLNIFYTSMMVGAHSTNEIVFREMVNDKENRPVIYEGMPLHTEFRVFYDFDNKNVIGISNYWHPNLMNSSYLKPHEFENYTRVKGTIFSEFDSQKEMISEEVHKFMEGCAGLNGRWSVDVMKNGNDYWLIDMARMERSALVEEMEQIQKRK